MTDTMSVLLPLVIPLDCGSVGTVKENEPLANVRTLCIRISLSSFRNLTWMANGPFTVRLESTSSITLPASEKL